ncbi:NAD(P)-dependent oxidoreductase [Burkholderia vietnamiensis]|uniref:FAD-dependent pyridine nucleotide-disulfide oxidoreductase n=1 Tax=Burkholderia vietnamiensis (strain G4 / LMG 22486) TaxID=269482 RepID=A4JQA1_BURVG|nr:NAD(P)-dependent oxidoreductase [Burkholderia vietnamiensis]ABO58454.1 FAD-dependent pyridine nucleotide-disulfide oxidoreductase [Burkholderia vietnamiensis G4]AOK14152.1 dihydropyrimidine dehydrogenase [Burkholderia vietnamiensis]KKI40176.1 dihydropyrimidine dehydrogenase [Burkholderia vietnamiensis]KVE61332.1 dihydropyrimidine dehydrogenase [Burkholderia vietnamiensis]KVF05806.1 dihydropyrimidine dehydrogenase [Burkholderia vietnamiensis]
MTTKPIGDIAAHRLSSTQLSCEFADIAPLLDPTAAAAAASRCHYCYDAPCVQACPTQIDIPSFIRKIGNGNLKGAAMDILGANPLGGMCARVCPTEILCEGACVRNHQDAQPVAIGALQRHATDWAMATGAVRFTRAPDTGRHVAVVGAGPAGLACAHRLALAGHRVTLFDARAKAGGLNEYGIAAYKTVDDFAQREVEWLLSVGGIALQTGVALGRDVTLDALREGHDAVFVAMGLTGVRTLAIDGEQLSGVMNAVDFIEQVRQADALENVPVGRRVVVIGGGNTAIDAAVQSRKLGAQRVTMAYRRGVDAMSATWAEREFAQTSGVTLVTHAKPVRIAGEGGHVARVEFESASGERFAIEADMVLKAIGQTLVPAGIDAALLTADGTRIAVDAHGRTVLPDVWAGGDCAATDGIDLTVQAVQDGKRAAAAIDAALAQRDAKAA